jgi:oligoendopeptidase F
MRAPAGRAATTQAPYGLDHLLLKFAIQINSFLLQQSLVFLTVCTTLQALRTSSCSSSSSSFQKFAALFLSALSKLVLDLPQDPVQAQAQACNSMLCFFQPGLSKLVQTKNSSSKLQAQALAQISAKILQSRSTTTMMIMMKLKLLTLELTFLMTARSYTLDPLKNT